MSKHRTFLAVFACLAVSAVLAQSTPTTINYQGRLTDNSPQQNPINGNVPMRFAIWDASSGGANLWQEPASGGLSVPVTSGLFNIALGSNGVPLTPSVFAGATSSRYLEITINPDTPQQEILAPRQLITATPYANLAANSNGLGGVAPAGWQKALSTPSCPAGQFLAGITAAGTPTCATAPQGPPGPAGPSSIASCPAGMTTIQLQYSTLCWAVGTAATWDNADNFCDANYRAGLCTLDQWREAVCRAGQPNPGRSWLPTPTGVATFATVSGCTGESIATSAYTSSFATTCCLEWMKY